jgi:hypothetical protein
MQLGRKICSRRASPTYVDAYLFPRGCTHGHDEVSLRITTFGTYVR